MPTDIGDMIIEQSSGGNSTYAVLCSTVGKKNNQHEKSIMFNIITIIIGAINLDL